MIKTVNVSARECRDMMCCQMVQIAAASRSGCTVVGRLPSRGLLLARARGNFQSGRGRAAGAAEPFSADGPRVLRGRVREAERVGLNAKSWRRRRPRSPPRVRPTSAREDSGLLRPVAREDAPGAADHRGGRARRVHDRETHLRKPAGVFRHGQSLRPEGPQVPAARRRGHVRPLATTARRPTPINRLPRGPRRGTSC